MSLFLLFFIIFLCISLWILFRKRKTKREIGLFIALSLLGLKIWMFYFLELKLKPTEWVSNWFEMGGIS